MTGVGGQGIGLLSETIIRAFDYAGEEVRGTDTHGLAQRGGIVSSSVRIGQGIFSPLIEPGKADFVLALERTEALRACRDMLKDGGVLVYYDASWQPLPVRLGESEEISADDIQSYAENRKISVHRVFDRELQDPRMQNTALLSYILGHHILPSLTAEHVTAALKDLLPEKILEANLALL